MPLPPKSSSSSSFSLSELLRGSKKTTTIKNYNDNVYDDSEYGGNANDAYGGDESGGMGLNEGIRGWFDDAGKVVGFVVGVLALLGFLVFFIAFLWVGVAFFRAERARRAEIWAFVKSAAKGIAGLVVQQQTGAPAQGVGEGAGAGASGGGRVGQDRPTHW
ncbi:hypothetical protein FQN54_007397 [Arachnomyces sp. PD_36]|nr:hypothetical protein FQN54_007397 [Arachnomyces sp. PD_36]